MTPVSRKLPYPQGPVVGIIAIFPESFFPSDINGHRLDINPRIQVLHHIFGHILWGYALKFRPKRMGLI